MQSCAEELDRGEKGDNGSSDCATSNERGAEFVDFGDIATGRFDEEGQRPVQQGATYKIIADHVTGLGGHSNDHGGSNSSPQDTHALMSDQSSYGVVAS